MNKWRFNGKLYENDSRVATEAQLKSLYEYIRGKIDSDETSSEDILDELQTTVKKNSVSIAALQETINSLLNAESIKF